MSEEQGGGWNEDSSRTCQKGDGAAAALRWTSQGHGSRSGLRFQCDDNYSVALGRGITGYDHIVLKDFSGC